MSVLEAKLQSESVLSRHRVRITETLGVSSAILGECKEVLSLEIDACTLEREFVLDMFGQRVAK